MTAMPPLFWIGLTLVELMPEPMWNQRQLLL